MTQLSTAPAGSCETAAASANFPMLESARTCAEPAKPSSYFTLDAKKKKNGSRSCALCSITSAGVLYTGCSPTQGSHAESTENSVYTSVRTLPVLLFPLCTERSAYAHLALLAVQTVAHNVSVHWEVVLSDRKRRMVFDERTKETSIATKKKSNPPLTKENKSWRC